MKKLCYIKIVKYDSVQKRHELWSHEKTWGKLKYILLSVKNNLKKLWSIWIQWYDILKSQNYRDNEKISGVQSWNKGGMSRWGAEDLQGSENTLCTASMAESCHYSFKSIDCTALRVTPNANYRLWVIMKCQYRLIEYNKWTTLLWNVDKGGGYTCVVAGLTWTTSIPAVFCEPKVSLKDKG